MLTRDEARRIAPNVAKLPGAGAAAVARGSLYRWDSFLLIPRGTIAAKQLASVRMVYDKHFYDRQVIGSLHSARIFLSYVFQIWSPRSVIDYGCGLGTWLKACKELGVQRLVGLDGNWVKPEMLLDQSIEFRTTNLQLDVPLEERYDLAMSLEAAEHLPTEAGERFVRSIIRASDAVIFSAAFYGQPGTDHINTRPHSYWANMFLANGYKLFDIFRPEFWSDNRVEPWYRQNTFLYVKTAHPLHDALIATGHQPERDARFVDCVHPWLYLLMCEELRRRSTPT